MTGAAPTLRAGLLAVLLGLACGGGAAAQTAAPADPAMPEIRAQVSPVRSTTLSAEIAGRIAELTVREGDRFEAGQRLAGLDCSLHKARLDKAQAQAQAARKAHQVAARLDRLNSISTLEVDTAAARAAEADAEVNVMRTLVERCTILAPFPGRVVELKVKAHQFVAEGKEVVEILDDRELEVEVIVPSRWLAWLAVGTPFALTVDETGRTHPARVTRLGARIDPVSQSVKVFGGVDGAVDGAAADLMAGMSGTATFSPPSP